jgi:hypothetical protein
MSRVFRRGPIALTLALVAGCHLALPLAGGPGEADAPLSDAAGGGDGPATDGPPRDSGPPLPKDQGSDGSPPAPDGGADGTIASPCLAPGGKGWDCYLPSSDICEAECVDGTLSFVIRCDAAHCECEVSGQVVGSCPFTAIFNKCTTCSGAGWSCCSSKF